MLCVLCCARRPPNNTPKTKQKPKKADVAILDEIDSGLDIDALRDVSAAINGLKRPDGAVLMVTHYRVSLLFG